MGLASLVACGSVCLCVCMTLCYFVLWFVRCVASVVCMCLRPRYCLIVFVSTFVSVFVLVCVRACLRVHVCFCAAGRGKAHAIAFFAL